MIIYDGGSFFRLAIVAINNPKIDIDDFVENCFLHLLNIRDEFSTYGRLVICLDSKIGYWRTDKFKEYKGNRKQDDKLSEKKKLEKAKLRKWLSALFSELLDNSPFFVIMSDKAEADDIVAVLANTIKEENLIYSSDKDLLQLEQTQHSPALDEIISGKGKYKLLEHIIRGDASDGIPNIRSDADTFLCPDKRQTTIRKSLIEEVEQFGIKILTPLEISKFERNKELIDLTMIPKWLVSQIKSDFRLRITIENDVDYSEFQVFEKRYIEAKNRLIII